MDNLFADVAALEGKRVKMIFSDGHEVIARLLSAVTDIDGSQHLIYDQIEWATQPNSYESLEAGGFYAEGETLISIDWQKEDDA